MLQSVGLIFPFITIILQFLGEVLKTTSNSVKKAIDDKCQMSDKVSVVANEDVKCILPKQKTGISIKSLY